VETALDAPQEKLLFTPGPLNTSPTVKQAMLRDLGSRDDEFTGIVAEIRSELLALAGTSAEDGFDAVLMQGSGTFGLESVCASGIPADGELLVLINGVYGRRIAHIARTLGMAVWELDWDEDHPVAPGSVEEALVEHPEISHVAMVHCETTTGIMNPLQEVAEIVKSHGRHFIVDAMSSFGAVPIDMSKTPIDYLVSSSNKCMEGVPGFSFVLFRTEVLEATKGAARSVSLDLREQWKTLEETGQFRFTPPTHAILAFRQALRELKSEGGPEARGSRYSTMQEMLSEGMLELGFQPYLASEVQSPVITTFRYHKDSAFDFEGFYHRLTESGFVIYPGKLSEADCFRVGSAGQIGVEEIIALLVAVRTTLEDMGVTLTPV
jgi:2-aminoethylphosphonate-pyruvate transaminase